MELSELFELPNEKIWSVIRSNYNEDPDLVNEQIIKFKDWLKLQNNLPKDVDEHLIRNFIRHRECDVETAKRAFENYVISRSVIKDLLPVRDFNEEYFKNMVHRITIVPKNLTIEGYRVGMLKVPADANEDVFKEAVHYLSNLADIVLLYDTCAGYIGIYDLQNVPLEQLIETNIELLEDIAEMIYNTLPFRIINIHFLNVPDIREATRSILKKYFGSEITSKILIHKNSSTLKEYLPHDMIPVEYDGGLDLGESAENMKKFFIQNKDWTWKASKLNFNGTIPKAKGCL